MDKLHLFIIAAFSIQSVAPLPQDYSLFDSSDQLASDPGSFNIASASPNEDLFSSFGSDTALGTQTTDWDPYDSGSNLDPLTLGDEIQWDLPSPEIAGSGCSGTLGKREGGTSCAATNQDQEEDPCDPDKEPMCCNPTQMFRSRWQGGGFNMDGCSQCRYRFGIFPNDPRICILPQVSQKLWETNKGFLVVLLSSACLASGGSVQCCIKQVVSALLKIFKETYI